MKFFCELKKIVDDSYDIEIGRGLSDTLISDIKNGLCGRIKKFAVVTDSIVEPLYAKGIYEKLISAGYSADMFVIPEGEKSKTRAMKEFVEDAMLEKGYRRDCCVICCRYIRQRRTFYQLRHYSACRRRRISRRKDSGRYSSGY